MHPILRLEARHNGARADARLSADPARLSWEHPAGRVDLVYESADAVRLRGSGLGLRLTAAELATYVLWSATVAPAGVLGRPAVLMSKHWMDKVWSWDHCFNALALAVGDPGLARHQFQLPFDHQDATGALPDSVTHSEVLHNLHLDCRRLSDPRRGRAAAEFFLRRHRGGRSRECPAHRGVVRRADSTAGWCRRGRPRGGASCRWRCRRRWRPRTARTARR